MELAISHVRIRTVFVLIFSKARGLTLSFKTDPLESIQVSSTFDGIVESVRVFLQREIEEKLRVAFRDELPALLHAWSLEWLRQSESEDLSLLIPHERIQPCGPSFAGYSSSISSSLLPTRAESPRELKKDLNSYMDEGEDRADLHYFSHPNIVHRASSGAAVIDPIQTAQEEMKELRQNDGLRKSILRYLPIPSHARPSSETIPLQGRPSLYDDSLFTSTPLRRRTSSWMASDSKSTLGSCSSSVYDPEEFRSQIAYTLQDTATAPTSSLLRRSGSSTQILAGKSTDKYYSSSKSSVNLATRLSLLRSVNISSSPFSSSTLESNKLVVGRHSRKDSKSK